MTRQQADEAAARGAAFLDEVAPGWRERIDVERLDIASSCSCVLGQLWEGSYHPFTCAVDDLGIVDSVRHLGFEVPGEEVGEAAYSVLTQAWRGILLA